MNIVGFNFTKIEAHRDRAVVGKININNNIAVRDVKEAKIGVGDRSAASVQFSFKSNFQPDVAGILLEGEVMLLGDKKEVSELVTDYQKNKRIPTAVGQRVMNHILDKCSVEALVLSRDLNLPSPVKLPQVKTTEAPTKKAPVKKTGKKK